MTAKIAVLAGDGIGPEIITATLGVVDCLQQEFGFVAELEHAAIGGAGYDHSVNHSPSKRWPFASRPMPYCSAQSAARNTIAWNANCARRRGC